MSRTTGGVFAALLVMTVAACGAPSAPRAPVVSKVITPLSATPGPSAAVPPAPTLLSPVSAVSMPANLGRPDRLVGLPPLEVTALLGEPGFLRRDGPSELWQYRGETCVLDIFLHKDANGARVTHVEMRGRSVARADVDGCWRTLVATAKPKTSD